MNELIVNVNEIESCWEKDNICFVKMKSGKAWLCLPEKDVTTGSISGMACGYPIRTKDYILKNNGLISLQLSYKVGGRYGL